MSGDTCKLFRINQVKNVYNGKKNVFISKYQFKCENEPVKRCSLEFTFLLLLMGKNLEQSELHGEKTPGF